MKLIKPYAEIWEQGPDLGDMLRHIERCARVCYKSEDYIKEGTAEKMVKMLIDRGHTAMLEHGTVYLTLPENSYGTEIHHHYICNPYAISKSDDLGRVYITTNYRVIIENNWVEDINYCCGPTELHEKRITVKFVCDRGISHELVRHRVFSFAQESTRYCNYSKDKFGNEITFIIPCWFDIPEGKYVNMAKQSKEDGEYKQLLVHENAVDVYPLTTTKEGRFIWNVLWAEHDYFDLLTYPDYTPQQVRAVLPNALKTEVCMTGFLRDWEHFFELRCDKAAHPQMRELAIPLKETFQKEGLIK